MTHAMFTNATERELKVHAASSGVSVKVVPPAHTLCIEVPDGRYAFFQVWGDGVLLATTCAEPVCPPPPPPKPKKGTCFLCERPRGPGHTWWYEDMEIWVAECPLCGDIVIALKDRHGSRLTWEDLTRAARRGIKRYPDLVVSTDRSCYPNHPHVHLVKKQGQA